MVGSITNILSLSYFIGKAERTLSNRIFIVLNVFDLLISLLHVTNATFVYCSNASICGWDKPLFLVFVALTDVSIESTAFATCLLTVTRTISLCFPFYSICKKTVGIAGLTSFVLVVSRILLRFYFVTKPSEICFYIQFDVGVTIVSLSTIILVNLFSSALSTIKLLSDREKVQDVMAHYHNQGRTNQKATITILLVSVLFCFFNAIFCVSLCLQFLGGCHPRTLPALWELSLWLAIPLNSAINPIIYFTRKKDMGKYLKELFTKVF